MLDKARKAVRLSTTAYDDELERLMSEAKADLFSEGVRAYDLADDPLIQRAVITYCRLNFGSPPDYDRMAAAYDKQKAKLKACRRYRIRGEDDRHGPCGCGDAY